MKRALWGALFVVPLAAAACGSDAPIEPPEPLYGEEPVEYPLSMWDSGVEGRTVLRVHVTARGEVDSVEVAESSGTPALDSAAVEGVSAMRFRPARQGDRRIDAWATVPIEFTQRPPAPLRTP